MTMIVTELQKWKRNKIVWGISALTVLLAIFAIERACSISRSSPYMDSFGDLYTKILPAYFSLLYWECSPLHYSMTSRKMIP